MEKLKHEIDIVNILGKIRNFDIVFKKIEKN